MQHIKKPYSIIQQGKKNIKNQQDNTEKGTPIWQITNWKSMN